MGSIMIIVYSFSDNFDSSVLLSMSDEKRRNRYLNSARRSDGELLAYALTRKALSYFGIDYDEERKHTNEYGREYLTDKSVFYNIAHSQNLCVCVADEENCGIDCEKITNKNYDRLIDGRFTENEKKYIENSADKKYAFYEIWTRKESYLKMTGTGLGGGILKTDITDECVTKKMYNFIFGDYAVCCCGKINTKVPPTPIELKQNELLSEEYNG